MDIDRRRMLVEVRKMMTMPGWQVLVNELNIRRESILTDCKNAKLSGPAQEHGWEYYQGKLAAFDSLVQVLDALKIMYEEAEAELAEEEKEKLGVL